MKLYNTPITIDLLKKHNAIFFSTKSTDFHGDSSYQIIGRLLKVNNDLTGTAYYTIGDDYRLTYTTL